MGTTTAHWKSRVELVAKVIMKILHANIKKKKKHLSQFVIFNVYFNHYKITASHHDELEETAITSPSHKVFFIFMLPEPFSQDL